MTPFLVFFCILYRRRDVAFPHKPRRRHARACTRGEDTCSSETARPLGFALRARCLIRLPQLANVSQLATSAATGSWRTAQYLDFCGQMWFANLRYKIC